MPLKPEFASAESRSKKILVPTIKELRAAKAEGRPLTSESLKTERRAAKAARSSTAQDKPAIVPGATLWKALEANKLLRTRLASTQAELTSSERSCAKLRAQLHKSTTR